MTVNFSAYELARVKKVLAVCAKMISIRTVSYVEPIRRTLASHGHNAKVDSATFGPRWLLPFCTSLVGSSLKRFVGLPVQAASFAY